MSTIERMADRCLLPGFIGANPPDWILRRAAAGLGGVCLYARNVESPTQLSALTARLHAENPRLIIAIDEEGGDVTRLEAATGSSYPGNLALGTVGDVELTRSVARSMGAELAAAGIDLDLAPDADVNSNGSPPTRLPGSRASRRPASRPAPSTSRVTAIRLSIRTSTFRSSIKTRTKARSSPSVPRSRPVPAR